MWGRATSARRCLLFAAAAAEQDALRVFRQIRYRLVDVDYGTMRVASDNRDVLGRRLRHLVDTRGDVGGALVEVVGKIANRCGRVLGIIHDLVDAVRIARQGSGENR